MTWTHSWRKEGISNRHWASEGKVLQKHRAIFIPDRTQQLFFLPKMTRTASDCTSIWMKGEVSRRNKNSITLCFSNHWITDFMESARKQCQLAHEEVSSPPEPPILQFPLTSVLSSTFPFCTDTASFREPRQERRTVHWLSVTGIQVEHLLLRKSLQGSPLPQDSTSPCHPLGLWTQELFPKMRVRVWMPSRSHPLG